MTDAPVSIDWMPFVLVLAAIAIALAAAWILRRWRRADAQTRWRWSGTALGALVVSVIAAAIVGSIAVMMILQEFDQALTH